MWEQRVFPVAMMEVGLLFTVDRAWCVWVGGGHDEEGNDEDGVLGITLRPSLLSLPLPQPAPSAAAAGSGRSLSGARSCLNPFSRVLCSRPNKGEPRLSVGPAQSDPAASQHDQISQRANFPGQ